MKGGQLLAKVGPVLPHYSAAVLTRLNVARPHRVFIIGRLNGPSVTQRVSHASVQLKVKRFCFNDFRDGSVVERRGIASIHQRQAIRVQIRAARRFL